MTKRTTRLALGLDFGTESARALLVDLDGQQRGVAVARYPHGQLTESLPGSDRALPAHYALQHPTDWMTAASRAVRRAMKQAGTAADAVIGIGVDFTSCTMLPTRSDGTPLCLEKRFAQVPLAWPKLWKHHGAQSQTDRLNEVARRRKEPFLRRYGNIIGLEWFFPKVLETLERAPQVYRAADVWLEAGDWFVWQLVGGEAASLPRSTCQAGYKAMWSRQDGYPSPRFFRALHPEMSNIVDEKMPGRLVAPGQRAGTLTAAMARRLGLAAGTPVSAAIIDAHAGVPGAGAHGPGTLVMVLGTSSCHMLNARQGREVPGVAGVVEEGILPGLFGYETGQAAVGDAFDWLRRVCGQKNFQQLTRRAGELEPGSGGVLCLDWFNGCRTPLMDGALTGGFVNLALHHGPEHLYRALLEASAYGLRWIVELLEDHDVPVKRLVATGGLPHHNPLLVPIYADVLGKPIVIHPSAQGPALGGAILGTIAAGRAASGFTSVAAAIRSMAAPRDGDRQRQATTVRPRRAAHRRYDAFYAEYRELARRELLRQRSG